MWPSAADAADEATATAKPAHKMQHQLSTWLEDVRFKSRVTAASTDIRHRARLLALTAQNTANWLYGSCYLVAPRLWLPSHAFFAAVKLRLGVPQGESRACPLCHKSVSDEFGYHALSCNIGGHHTLMHNNVLDELQKLAAAAMCNPSREVRTFSSDKGLRIDLTASIPGELSSSKYLIDVCITNCLCESTLKFPQRIGPNAAATAYEDIKNRKYVPALDASYGSSSTFYTDKPMLMPAAFDIFGAVGASFRPVLAKLSAQRARQSRQSIVLSQRVTAHRLNYCITRSVAETVCANKRSSSEFDMLRGNAHDLGDHDLLQSAAAQQLTAG